MSTVADLWALQTTDLALEAINQRLVELKKQQGESAELNSTAKSRSCPTTSARPSAR